MDHIVTVRARGLSVRPSTLVAGSSGADALVLDLDDEWEGLQVFIILGEGESALAVEWDGEPVDVPGELLADPGWLAASVVGMDPSGGKRVVTMASPHAMRVVQGGETADGGAYVAMV